MTVILNTTSYASSDFTGFGYKEIIIAGTGESLERWNAMWADGLADIGVTATASSDSAAAALVSENNAATSEGNAFISEGLADADATATAADRVQTDIDASATAADRVQTALDAVDTGNDATATAADAVSTSNDASSTADDAIDTAADATQTGIDAAAAAVSAGDAAAVSVSALTTTSVTSNDIGTGTKTWAVADDDGWQVGQQVIVAETAAATNFNFGTITAVVVDTSIQVSVNIAKGSGTGITAWSITASGPEGTTDPILNAFSEIVAPDADNDSTEGFEIGSTWIDTVANEAYRCVDASVAAAIWINTTLETSELGTMALQNSNSVSITGGAISGSSINSNNVTLTGGSITGTSITTNSATITGGTITGTTLTAFEDIHTLYVEVVEDRTYILELDAEFANTFTELIAETTAGSVDIELTLNGSTSNIITTVNTTRQTDSTFADATKAEGDDVKIVTTNNSGALDLYIKIKHTRGVSV